MLHIDATDLPRVMNCDGSLRMSPSFPRAIGDQTERDLGNAAHWLAKEAFDGKLLLNDALDRKAPNGVFITSEMIDHVSGYLQSLDHGEMEIRTTFAGENWQVDARCDHVKYDQADNSLTIDDFKYGHGIVEPEMHWTLIAHAIGYCLTNRIAPNEIYLRIYQPRPYHPDGKLRTWNIQYHQLDDYRMMINHTLSNPSDQLKTNLLWCRYCPALATCPAARNAGYNAIDTINIAYDENVSDDQLAYDLDLLQTAKSTLANRLTALEDLAKYRINNGGVVPNYFTEQQYANTRFKPGITAATLKAIFGKDLSKPGTVTPAEAKRRDCDADMLALFTERPTTGLKLVRRDATKQAERLLSGRGETGKRK